MVKDGRWLRLRFLVLPSRGVSAFWVTLCGEHPMKTAGRRVQRQSRAVGWQSCAGVFARSSGRRAVHGLLNWELRCPLGLCPGRLGSSLSLQPRRGNALPGPCAGPRGPTGAGCEPCTRRAGQVSGLLWLHHECCQFAKRQRSPRFAILLPPKRPVRMHCRSWVQQLLLPVELQLLPESLRPQALAFWAP